MSINPISNGEGGGAIRAKLNEVISETNSIDSALAGKADVSHTHTVPFYWLDFLDYDPTLGSNSSEKVPVTSAVKGYADTKLSKAGGTMTGALTLAGDAASALQPVTKQQLEAALLNMGKRTRVRAKTTGDVNLGGGLVAGATIDGVTVALGDLVLAASQSTTSQNGVYVVPASGSAARSAEFDTYDEHPGSLVTVAEGSTQADTVWLCTSNAGGTLGSTAIAFSQLRVSGELLAANNLSDLANAATARSNLGVVIGTHVQAYNANLAAFAGLSLIADRLPYANGAGTLALTPLTSFGRSLIDDANAGAALNTLGGTAVGQAVFTSVDASAARAFLGVTIGTNVQAFNANLTQFSGLSLIADRLPYANGTGTLALTPFSALGRTLVGAADAATARTALAAMGTGGGTFSGNIGVGAGVGSSFASIELGAGRSADGDAYFDLVGDTTYSDYGFRFIRKGGANSQTQMFHRGTGDLYISTVDGAAIKFAVSGVQHTTLAADGSIQLGASNVVITGSRHHQLRSYTVATLPSAATAGQLIYVSDGTSNKRLAVSDGTNWRFPDGNIVS